MKTSIRYIIFLLLGWSGIAYCNATYFLITHGSQDPYWTTLFEGAKTAANDMHIKLQILAPAGANDIAKQVQYLDSASATHPLGIATTLPSDLAFSQSLQRAKLSNIPVIAFDSKPKDREKNPYLAYVGSDNEYLGRMLATKALEEGKLKQRVVILNPQPGHKGLEARARGIKSVLSSQNIVVEELDIGVDPNTVQAHVKSYFIRYPNTSAIFCLTSQALDPVGELITQTGKSNFKFHPVIYTFDKTPNTEKFLAKGVVNYAVDQQPFLMGYASITELVLYNRNHLLPVDINTAAG